MTITVHRDVVFATPQGYRPLALDLYISAVSAAVCVYLHGGGWRAGSRRVGPGAAARWTDPSFFEQVAQLGLGVASVDYRLSGEAAFPAQKNDVASAVQFLADHRQEYGLPAPLVVWGVSAGAHLAALRALTPTPGGPSVRAAVCWYPPTDLDALAGDIAAAGGVPDRTSASREGSLIGGALDDRPDVLAAASPVTRVGGTPPPFLLVHGDADISVPPVQSRRLADALRAAGGSAVVELVPGATHMFPELDDDATSALVLRSVDFLLGQAG